MSNEDRIAFPARHSRPRSHCGKRHLSRAEKVILLDADAREGEVGLEQWTAEQEARREDGLWDHGELHCERSYDEWPCISPRLATCHVCDVLNEFGVLDRLRPH
ncbi:MAG: hypothetical protein R6X33_06525 [Candidatus Brocadiia bacterium]